MLNFAETIRRKRQEKGLQAKDMAFALHISPPAYSKIENGSTTLTVELAQKIAKVLDISLSELIEGKPTNIQIKNGSNSPMAVEHSTLILQNEKLIESQNKLSEQMIIIMQNQNELFKEVLKKIKSL